MGLCITLLTLGQGQLELGSRLCYELGLQVLHSELGLGQLGLWVRSCLGLWRLHWKLLMCGVGLGLTECCGDAIAGLRLLPSACALLLALVLPFLPFPQSSSFGSGVRNSKGMLLGFFYQSSVRCNG